jgi:ammonium transporter
MNKALIDILWVVICAGLVFVMQGGFLCLEAGLTRSKNSINVAVKNIADFGISVVLYWAFGFALMFGVSQGGWIGTGHFFAAAAREGPWFASFFLFQLMFCGTAVTIISGGVAERMRFSAYLIVAVLVSGLIYPVFGHWAWGGGYEGAPGWLAARGFVDFAGATVVHGVGGGATLAILLLIGPRQGRFPPGGAPANISGNNLPLAMLGVLLLWIGWIGFNGGSTLAMNDRVPGIVVNTIMAAGAGLVTALIVGWWWHRYPVVNLVMNGCLAGLVAITASCYAVDTVEAVCIGAIGTLFMLGAQYGLDYLRIDDVVGAVPVHLAAGIWGTLAVALFGAPRILETGLTTGAQLQVQALGVGVCAVWTFGVTYGVLFLVNRVFPLRVTPEQEHIGLNVAEHRMTTEILDLLTVMEHQAATQDLGLRAPVEPFTEVGQIAQRYNKVIEALQEAAVKRDQAEEKIKISLSEKEVLLKEIHHRVKNNLQIISSILRLQSGYSTDQKVRGIFEDSQNRIQSMALIHENLYGSEDLVQIDFAKYLRSLTSSLFRVYKVGPDQIDFDIRIDDIEMDIATAIPCGLIVNELVSNCLKYAFPDGGKGKICIAVSAAGENRLALSVLDNGIGFPEEVDFHNTQSLGLKVVISLVQQIKGNIELYKEGGTEFRIEFPVFPQPRG